MDLSTRSDAEILEIANPIMVNLMDASTAIDHERHIRDFTDRAKGMLSKDWFLKICQDYQDNKGFFTRREFVAVLRRPDSIVIVWKQWFTIQHGEFLAELVLVQEDDRYLVDHVMVL
ncbi:MAG: hypothetical protein ACREO1_01545 [Arenimonas sp.]